MAKTIKRLDDLQPDTQNANKGTQRGRGMVEASLREVGAGRSILADKTGRIIAGNKTLDAWADIGGEIVVVPSDGTKLVVVQREDLDLDDPTGAARKMAYLDNRAGEVGLEWDAEQLLADMNAGLDLSALFRDDELDALLAEWGQEDGGGNDGDEEDALSRYDVPDALFVTDNDYDIPLLDSKRQAKFLDLPLTRWGEIARTSKMVGTWHFYTDDYKFDALWADPSNVINSKCVNVVEPNFSTNEQMPMVVGLWAIYRKRWLARFWQDYGINVFVDLNVSRKFKQLNLLGVPKGWTAYMTRSVENMGLDELDDDYARALDHAGVQPLFVVYGGSKLTKEHCKAHGWLWIPENMHVKEGRVKENGDG